MWYTIGNMKRIHLLISAGLVFGIGLPVAALFAGQTTFSGPPGCGTPPCSNVPGVIWNSGGVSAPQPNAQMDFTGTAWATSPNIKSNLGLASGMAFRVDATSTSNFNMGNWGNGAQPFIFTVNGGLAVQSIGVGALGIDGRMQADKFCFNPGGAGDCITSWPSGAGAYVAKTGDTMTGSLYVTGTNYGVNAKSTGVASMGVYGAGGTGLSIGVYGTGWTGVSASGTNYGVTGRGPMYGVGGYSNANGSSAGVYGNSNSGMGVYGTGLSQGVYGYGGGDAFTIGTGVFGWGKDYGVSGWGSTTGVGVKGDGTTGVYGTGINYGVYAQSTSPPATVAYGVFATSNYIGVQSQGTAYGVIGQGAIGVRGTGSSYGLYGDGATNGVYGSGTNIGVWGKGSNAGSVGVSGIGVMDGVDGQGQVTGVFGSGPNIGVQGSGLIGTYGNGTSEGAYGTGPIGVEGHGSNSTSTGVLGTGLTGVYGNAAAYALSTGVSGRGSKNGVYGYGSAVNSIAVYGDGSGYSGTTGVYGTGDTGVQGISTKSTGWGVWGDAPYAGVYAHGGGTSGMGVLALGNVSTYTPQSNTGVAAFGSNTGVYASGTNYAFYGTGNLAITGTATKPGGGSWTASSDARLKDIHGSFTRGLSDLLKIDPVFFNYKIDNPKSYDSTKEYVGVIAQEVKKAIPEAVAKDADGYFTVNEDPIIWTMVNSIKELKSENDTLKAKVDDLTSRIEAIESKLK